MQDFFFVRLDNRYVKIDFHEIRYAEACANYVRIITIGRQYMVLTSLKQLEKLLPRQLFCRIHRSYIVSLAALTAFEKEEVWIDGKRLPIGAQYRYELPGRVTILVPESRRCAYRSVIR